MITQPRGLIFFAVCFLLAGCAVQKAKAPQIDSLTASTINFATLVTQGQADYQTFFEDVGARAKAGQITAGQVAALNAAGNQMRDALDAAGSMVETYDKTGDQSIAAKISAYLQLAAQAYSSMYQERSGMLAGAAAAKKP